MKDLSDLLKEPEEENCKGLIFRGHISSFIDKRGKYVYQESMALLKKLSCKGCPSCDFFRDDLKERSTEKSMLPIITNIVDGDLYKLTMVNESADYETGIIDDWDLLFVNITKKKVAHVQK